MSFKFIVCMPSKRNIFSSVRVGGVAPLSLLSSLSLCLFVSCQGIHYSSATGFGLFMKFRLFKCSLLSLLKVLCRTPYLVINVFFGSYEP